MGLGDDPALIPKPPEVAAVPLHNFVFHLDFLSRHANLVCVTKKSEKVKKLVTRQVHITEALHTRLKVHAAAAKVAMNDVVEAALKLYLPSRGGK